MRISDWSSDVCSSDLSCKACDEICPVNIEILDKILDMRRYLSLMESGFPTELGTAYRGMENSGNPWGMSQRDRAAWTSKVDGVPIVEGGDSLGHEYLYWVGCAGSFDDTNQKVTISEEIGIASDGERECMYVVVSGVDVSTKQTKTK